MSIPMHKNDANKLPRQQEFTSPNITNKGKVLDYQRLHDLNSNYRAHTSRIFICKFHHKVNLVLNFL
ncbi:hypothetical protein AQUCO_03700039v1 [Aquilegia coerulea]|uniref:Uncharacterized protein n=1 Tax=Aquilegia coerulea TaxID=218851 RepID=A0A2G5CTB7_AQUCA|nr:hypothetical protein AQUCO_03700039v1 [Aquilegia coerulea]